MKKLFLILVVCGFWFSVLADDHSARRYAAFDRNRVTFELFLLATHRVQQNLGLDRFQIEKLKSAVLLQPTNIPAIEEFREKQRQLLQHASSDLEKTGIKRRGNDQIDLMLQQYLEIQVNSILSSSQNKRLEELYLQMRGVRLVIEDTNLVREMNITPDQKTEMTVITNTYFPIISLLQQRLLRLQIQPIRSRDEADLKSEIGCLVHVTMEVQKDEDSELLEILDLNQRRAWDESCGKLLPIDWGIDSFSEMPFNN